MKNILMIEQDAQTFRNVWIDMFNYLTNTKNLHNILWVYSPDHSRGNRLAYYPGSAYVDVVALDVYTDDPVKMSMEISLLDRELYVL